MDNTIQIQKPISFKTYHIFLLILICFWMNIWILQRFVMTREVYHNLLSERLDAFRIDDYFTLIQKQSAWSYIAAPLFLWIQIAFVTLLLQFPLVIKFIDIPFKKVFRIATYAQIPLFASSFIKTVWLLQLKSHQITEEILTFVPFAITNFLDPELYAKSSLGILNKVNIFEIIWCIILIKGLIVTGKLRKRDALLIVLVTWTLILVFQWALTTYLTEINS